MQPVEPLGHSVPGLGPAQTHKHKKLETIRVKNCNRSSWWFQFMTTHTTTTYYMKTDEQLNDMTLVIVHKYYIIVNYYIVRYNMLYYCEVKTRKKVQLKYNVCLKG